MKSKIKIVDQYNKQKNKTEKIKDKYVIAENKRIALDKKIKSLKYSGRTIAQQKKLRKLTGEKKEQYRKQLDSKKKKFYDNKKSLQRELKKLSQQARKLQNDLKINNELLLSLSEKVNDYFQELNEIIEKADYETEKINNEIAELETEVIEKEIAPQPKLLFEYKNIEAVIQSTSTRNYILKSDQPMLFQFDKSKKYWIEITTKFDTNKIRYHSDNVSNDLKLDSKEKKNLKTVFNKKIGFSFYPQTDLHVEAPSIVDVINSTLNASSTNISGYLTQAIINARDIATRGKKLKATKGSTFNFVLFPLVYESIKIYYGGDFEANYVTNNILKKQNKAVREVSQKIFENYNELKKQENIKMSMVSDIKNKADQRIKEKLKIKRRLKPSQYKKYLEKLSEQDRKKILDDLYLLNRFEIVENRYNKNYEKKYKKIVPKISKRSKDKK